ncbi:LysR family transcriptional regulator [Mesorhizobium sp. CU2]|uniref:LysR substrate-binding domain-containing protein n=1 Tax=unclassified Mesorhizobium TaxID=325217 RepID=UPI0011289160|nr:MULTISPECIES: LysR substrate-binding domain-containing protein [unclassified Mesorhizobium]TPN88500.1 LysR family transcriptional regulator [Mesorhizobium sp. CU3]TPO08186.1 LysR family transcriptional regulator [Mesorhizobium sp. CU2]
MAKFRHIPPTQFLKGFEAASRLESFSRAAEELGLTQSAISHQMRLLEGHIGQPLFMRFGREVRLTDAGRDYQRTVRRCLELMEEGYRRLEPYRKPGSVVIYAPRDFSRRWLLHRLPALRRAVPTCEPWLDTSGAPVDFETMELDLAVVYADAPPEGCESLLIARDFLSPVATKELAGTLRNPVDLLGASLIHDERPTGWADWMRSAGVEPNGTWHGTNFSDSDLALAAAELGQGVALGSLSLAAEALASGDLVQLFDHSLDAGRGWYAISTESRLRDVDVLGTWHWLCGQGLPAG